MQLSDREPRAHNRLIGMLHLPALPGSPLGKLSMGEILTQTLRDADALVSGGVDALMLENFGDVPFYPGRVAASTVAQITAVAAEVRRRFAGVPLGINVLRNDGRSALAIAAAVGASFIRVNILTGARVADQGLIQGIAHDLLRDRVALGVHTGPGMVRIFADVDVKHSAALAVISIESEVEDMLHRGLADALIVSGTGTGKPTDVSHVKRVKAAAGAVPVYVGSGVTAETIAEFLPHANGFIVGTAFKAGGQVGNAVDMGRVKEIVRVLGGK